MVIKKNIYCLNSSVESQFEMPRQQYFNMLKVNGTKW